MTDEQIIKAVGICRTPDTCRGCPYHELHTAGCICALMKDVFDLINRRKAEIERLTAKILVKDNINDYNTAQLRIAREELRTTKTEAIKKFAERLKGYAIGENGSKEKAYFFVEVQDIDNLVKEMTEVQE